MSRCGRLTGVDVFKFYAVIAVIAIHATPFKVTGEESTQVYQLIFIFINQISRFAVPFFFIISGYFFGKKLHDGTPISDVTLTMIRRLALIYGFWCVVYILPIYYPIYLEYGALGALKLSYANALHLISDPVNLIFEGTKSHLWFLMALICAVFICATFIAIDQLSILIVIAFVLYIIGVLGGSYSDTPIGIDIGFNTRNGPFLSTLTFLTGYKLFSATNNLQNQAYMFGLIILVSGVLLHFTELYYLSTTYFISPVQDYVFSTYIMGVGAALMAIAYKGYCSVNPLAKLGRYTLGVYVVHLLFIANIRLVDEAINTPVWEIAYVLIVYGLSLVTVFIMSKITAIKKYVL